MTSARRLMDHGEVGRSRGEGSLIRLSENSPVPRSAVHREGVGAESLSSSASKSRKTRWRKCSSKIRSCCGRSKRLHERQQELVRLNGELEEPTGAWWPSTQSWMKEAGHLRRADEMKSRFLSNMSP